MATQRGMADPVWSVSLSNFRLKRPIDLDTGPNLLGLPTSRTPPLY